MRGARRITGALLALALSSGGCARPAAPDVRDAEPRVEVREAVESSTPASEVRPLPSLVGTLVLQASCGTASRPCRPGQDVGVRVASSDVDGVLYVFVVEDPGRSLFAGPLAVKAGAPLLLPVSLLAEEHSAGLHLEGTVLARPLDPDELERVRGGEPLLGAVSRVEVQVRAR